jgi:hypothetical protein
MLALFLSSILAANPACRYGVPPGACTADLRTCCPSAAEQHQVKPAPKPKKKSKPRPKQDPHPGFGGIF